VTINARTRPSLQAAFDERATRAETLTARSESAREPLQFAAGLYRVQGRLAGELEAVSLRGRLDEDLDALLAASAPLLRYAAEHGPSVLAADARIRMGEARDLAAARLRAWWEADRTNGTDYLSRALLRPYVETLAHIDLAPTRTRRAGHCPFCGGPPWIASRRSDAPTDGAQRFLGCSLCGGEWPLLRARCAACGEEDPDRLPSFRSEEYPCARIEACEVCRRYLKSIDLTLDGRAVPEVDDLVSVSMDLWARGQGFERIEPGLAGI
jgi:FdhE protein